jgi:hypothetical protein
VERRGIDLFNEQNRYAIQQNTRAGFYGNAGDIFNNRINPQATYAYGYSTKDGQVPYTYDPIPASFGKPTTQQESGTKTWRDIDKNPFKQAGYGSESRGEFFGGISQRFQEKAAYAETQRREATTPGAEARYAIKGAAYGYGAIASGAVESANRSQGEFFKGMAVGGAWTALGVAASQNKVTRTVHTGVGVILGGKYVADSLGNIGDASKNSDGKGSLRGVGNVLGVTGAEIGGFGVGQKGTKMLTGRNVIVTNTDIGVNSGQVTGGTKYTRIFLQNSFQPGKTVYSSSIFPTGKGPVNFMAVGGVPARVRAGRTSKAEMRKQSFNAQYDPRITEFQDFGIVRSRSPELKDMFVKERRAYVGPDGRVLGIQDVGLRTDVPALKSSGTPSNKVRFTTSQSLAGARRPLTLGPGEYVILSQTTRPGMPRTSPMAPRVEGTRSFSQGGTFTELSSGRIEVSGITAIPKYERGRVPGKAITMGGPVYGQKTTMPQDFGIPTQQYYPGRLPRNPSVGSPEARRMQSMDRLRRLRQDQDNRIRFQLPARITPGVRGVESLRTPRVPGMSTRDTSLSSSSVVRDITRGQYERGMTSRRGSQRGMPSSRTAFIPQVGRAQVPSQSTALMTARDYSFPTPGSYGFPVTSRGGRNSRDPVPFVPSIPSGSSYVPITPPPRVPGRVPPDIPPPDLITGGLPGMIPSWGPPGRGPGSLRGGSQPTSYAPSLGAGILNIRGKAIKGPLTGLEIRPLVGGSVRKRRKKR